MTLTESGNGAASLGIHEVIQALTTEYNDVYSLDIPTDHVTVFRFTGRALGVHEQLIIKDGYESAMNAYIKANVFCEDQEMMYMMTERSKVIDELTKNEVYTVHYRVKRDEEIHYFAMKCVRVGEADSFRTMIAGFANEDYIRSSAATLHAIEMDDLTGLYTQKAFYFHAEKILRENPNVRFDMVLSDIENFKRINQRYSRAMGDQVLQSIGEILLKKSNGQVLSGRFGSDQFVTIFRHDDSFSIPNMVKEIEDTIPVKKLIMKFGIYEDVEHDLPVSVLCDRMLVALRTIKRQYGKNFACYDDAIRKKEELQNQIEENMQKALEEKQFQIYYQPKYDLHTGMISGAEALVRWIHPEFGFMNPGMFIPLFEKNGFIHSLDWYVWETVCTNLKKWKADGLALFPVSVNVSRRDFEQVDLAKRIIELVDRHELDHSLLHIEITESCYAENPEVITESVRELHNAGFVIELDDFGTGYSSLTSLSSMPLDIMKLDMSLIQKDDPSSEQNILEFAMKIGKIMKLGIVQEGVETEAQMQRVKALGCDYIQGYYYSKPLPKAQFEEYIANLS